VTAGSSGGVFGLLGTFIADTLLNFSTVSWPAYRVLSLLVFAVVWLISKGQNELVAISHTSHLAGVATGALVGMLYLPSLPHEVLETVAPLVGALSNYR
jgi:membrane associated rhomboid family serine protease